MQIKDDFVAQLVEQLTLNQWAVGSSPTEVTGKTVPNRAVFFVYMPFLFVLVTAFKYI